MPLLPAVIPDIPEARAEVTAARLARNVAPLFGVPWPDGPFGPRTWACDYGKITLSEIARGAPLPTRSQARGLDRSPGAPWQLIDRVVVTAPSAALPCEIANATLTRFGPDTKAAVVLLAVNRLLAPITEAVESALRLLVDHDGAVLPTELRLAAWAGLVVETFRSQPALVAAGIRARAIQRELLVSWKLPLTEELAELRLTRCEIRSFGNLDDEANSAPEHPRTLDIADRTFRFLRVTGRADNNRALADADAEVDERDPDGRTASKPSRRLLRQETVDMLLRQLLDIGTSDDASYLWLSERVPGQLVVEALVPPTGLIDLFVRHALRSLSVDDHSRRRPTVLPRIPPPEAVDALPTLTRRAVVIALLTVLRHIQCSPVAREATRHHIVALFDDITDLARRALDEHDPVGVLARCRTADMAVHTLRYDTRNDLREPLCTLRKELRHVQELFRAGTLDRGAAAEAISSANVEINIVRWTNAVAPEAGLPHPDELNDELRLGWKFFHEALEIRPGPGERSAGYHLHNYAAFLASSTSGEGDLHEAVRLFGDVVIPARHAFYERTGSFLPLRLSLQVASRATTRLAEAAWARGDRAAGTRSAELGHGWIRWALDDDETRQMLSADPPTERACRLALLTAPALLIAVETGVSAAIEEDLATVRELVELARRWELSVGGGAHHARHNEVVRLQARLQALTVASPQKPGLPPRQ